MAVFKINSIRFRFTFGLAIVITLVMLLFSLPLISYNNKMLEENLRKQFNGLNDFSKKSLSTALWHYNFEYVDNYVESLFLYDDIAFASVTVNGKVKKLKVKDKYRDLSFAEFQSRGLFIAMESTIQYQNRIDVGTFRLAASRERLQNRIITHSIVLAAVIVLLILTIFGTNYLTTNWYLFKPLLKLERSVNIVSTGNLDARIDVDADDEIGRLAGSFKAMTAGLKKITASRDELNHEIAERKKAEKKIEGLNALKEKLLGSEGLPAKLHIITGYVVDILGAEFARIWLIEPGDICGSGCRHAGIETGPNACKSRHACLHLVASAGRYAALDGERRRVPLGCWKIGDIASSDDRGFVTNEVPDDPRIQDREWAKRLGLQSFAGYNLHTSEGRSIGVLALFSRQKMTAADDSLLQNIAGTASQVVQVSKSQEMLKQSEKKYRNFFDNAQIGFFRSRVSDGKMLESNDRMAEIFGYGSSEACVEKYIAAEHYLYPEKREEVVETLEREGEIINHRIQVRLDNGSVKWVQFSGTVTDEKDCFEGVAADITEQKLAQDELVASLKGKEVLLKEVHHRVKNNMQMIQSLLSLQLNTLKEDDLRKPLLDSGNRIKSMALVHETLYRSEDIADLDIETYFTEIIRHLMKIYHDPDLDIRLDLDIHNMEMGMDSCISCGLIINELVSNSLKYAFKGRSRGMVGVSLARVGPGDAGLRIRDDGQGLPPDFRMEGSQSLGLKIVDILVRGQLKGRLSMANHNGAEFKIRFPV